MRIPHLTGTEFRTTLFSHGWFDLAPWSANPGPPDPISASASRGFNGPDGLGAFAVRVEDGVPVLERLAGTGGHEQTVEKCLSLDIDVSELHDLAARIPGFYWIATGGFGRFLRSPTLFEDAMKVLFTTRTSWRNTKLMAERTVEAYGSPIADQRTFPGPEALRDVSEVELKDRIKCGYRARSIRTLVERAEAHPEIWTGEAWRDMGTSEFAEEVGAVTGLGPMSVSYLCRFYGKPLAFTIDSWVVGRCKELWGIDGDIQGFAENRYREFGRWAPSVFWFELTRYWHSHDPGRAQGEWWKPVNDDRWGR